MDKARIVSLGSYLPKKVMTNQDFASFLDTSDEWIYSRTGIKERRIADKDQSVADMGVIAAKNALEACQIPLDRVDCIIVATSTNKMQMPSSAAYIQASLGLKDVPIMDLNAACSGYIYGLQVAKAFIESGIYKTILLIASDKMSSVIDYTDRSSCILFGDGAGASIISSEGRGFLIKSVFLGGDGSQTSILDLPLGKYVRMQGKEVFKQAVRRMTESINKSMESAKITAPSIDYLVPHQANLRIIDTLSKTFKIAKDKIALTIESYANTSAGSIPITLDELVRKKEIKEGSHLLLVAFGAGVTFGSAVLEKEKQ
jgi:3-oxoacyl-[acyl-carrier-protein] synthase III